MRPTSNHLLVTWLPTQKIGSIHMPASEADYWNSDSVKMFRVLASGPGRFNKKGHFIPNEINPGDNVILDCRTGGRPEELGNNRYLIKDTDKAVIAVCPVQLGTPVEDAE